MDPLNFQQLYTFSIQCNLGISIGSSLWVSFVFQCFPEVFLPLVFAIKHLDAFNKQSLCSITMIKLTAIVLYFILGICQACIPIQTCSEEEAPAIPDPSTMEIDCRRGVSWPIYPIILPVPENSMTCRYSCKYQDEARFSNCRDGTWNPTNINLPCGRVFLLNRVPDTEMLV